MRGLSFKHSRMFKCNKIKMTKTVLFIILCIFVHFAIITFIVYKEGGDSNQQRNDLLHKPHVPDKLAVNMHQSRMAEQKISQRKNVKIADDVEIEDNGNDDIDAEDEEEKTTSRTGDYDYIIVGGGVAGCVLARRLSENLKISVLLLEAGVDDSDLPYIAVPHLAMTVMSQKDIIWDYWSEPQPHLNMKRKVAFNQGRVLGGSGSINAMGVTRGSRHDFDKWAQMGNKGWGYQDVLPYFIKSESMLTPSLKDPEYRGSEGFYKIREGYQLPLSKRFKDGIKELGYPLTKDYNGEQHNGFGNVQMNVDEHGYRSSTSAGYLRPVMGVWDNLKVITEATVTKIDIQDLLAKGVFYMHKGETKHASAKHEVIVSAGSLNTPKLMMLSGVGPKKHLKEKGVELVLDSPHVGSHLTDHIAMAHHFTTHAPSVDFFSFYSLLEFLLVRTGLWSTIGIQMLGYLNTKQQPKEEKFPNIEVILAQHLPVIPKNVMEAVKNGKDVEQMNTVLQNLEDSEPEEMTYAVEPVLLHPRMTGTVRLRSDDINDSPNITINYLQHKDDIKDLIEAIRFSQRLAKTNAFKELKPEVKVHGCTDRVYDTDDFWECYIRRTVVSLYHYTSTCRMSHDGNGVVDLQLRVNGIERLRVVDASVMPDVVSGHTMAATVMIAEKAADIIKENHKKILNMT